MKRLIILPLVAFAITGYAQKSLSIQAGPSYSTFKGSPVEFGKSIGYFGGLNFQDKFSKVLGVNASLYFLNQRNTYVELTSSIRSFNAIFGVSLYATPHLYFILGPEVGHTFDFKVEGEDFDADNQLRFAAVGGIGYQVIENTAIFARYHHAIRDQGTGYDYNVQVGFSFTFYSR